MGRTEPKTVHELQNHGLPNTTLHNMILFTLFGSEYYKVVGVYINKISYTKFTHKAVRDAVSGAIKSKTDVCCPNWRETPKDIKEQWWNHFKNHFEYDPIHEAELRMTFNKKAALRLKDMVWNVNTEEDGTWMSEEACTALLARKASDEFKKKSAQCKANRTKHKENGKVLGTHTMGRRSAVEQAAEMTKTAGKLPTAFELFRRAHTPKGKEMVESGRARSVVDSFTKEKTRLDEQEISYQEDEVFYKVVGGRKKGKVFGVGNADSLYFGPSGSAAATSAKSYAPGLLTQLQTQHEQLLKETVEKLNKDNEERLRRKFEERLVQLSSTYNPRITPRSRDSHEDGGDTSSSFQSVV